MVTTKTVNFNKKVTARNSYLSPTNFLKCTAINQGDSQIEQNDTGYFYEYYDR